MIGGPSQFRCAGGACSATSCAPGAYAASRHRGKNRRVSVRAYFAFFPIVNYSDGDHQTVREMLTGPGTLLALSDRGAHCGAIVDASVPSFMLTHWGRDRSRGPGLPLPKLVKMQTSETADFFGLADRGRLAAGLRAEVNLIDFDRLRLHQPEVVADLPAGGRRLVQRVEGYRATLVAGFCQDNRMAGARGRG
jgi:N-acyl-D-aspartate/D-glutamate deacylase